MVYVHGGAYMYGWPGSSMKPSYFMDEDVVLVTVAYRLGNLGKIFPSDKKQKAIS